jgi:hypothetical protein
VCIAFCKNSTAGERSSTGDARKLGRSALAESALIGRLVSDEKSQVDEWMEMLERTYRDDPPELNSLPAFAKKIATAIMLTNTFKSRRPSINKKSENPALAEEAANHDRPLAEVVFCRKGMPKRLLSHLRGWSPHQVGILQSLGLVDDETITNLTRSFLDTVKDDESDQHSEARESNIQPSLEEGKPVEVSSGADSSLSYNCDAGANAESDYDLTAIVGDEILARLQAKRKLLRNDGDRDVAATTHDPQKGRASPQKDTGSDHKSSPTRGWAFVPTGLSGRSVSPSKESSHAVDDLKPHGSSMFCFLPPVRRGSLRHPNVVKISSSPEHGDAVPSSPSKSTSGILLGDNCNNNSPLIRGRMKRIVSTDHLQGCCPGQQSEEETVKDMLFLRKGKVGHGLEVLLVPP